MDPSYPMDMSHMQGMHQPAYGQHGGTAVGYQQYGQPQQHQQFMNYDPSYDYPPATGGHPPPPGAGDMHGQWFDSDL